MRLVYVLDCADAEALADFWAPALGFRREPFHPPYLRLFDPAGRWPDLLLQQVPEGRFGEPRTDRKAPTCSNEVDLQHRHAHM